MKNVLMYAALFCFFASCNSNVTNKELNEILSNSLIKYDDTGNKQVLNDSYSFLNKNKDFRNDGLKTEFFLSASGVLMSLEKYDELESVLKRSNDIDSFTKEKTINNLNFYRFKNKDRLKAKMYLSNNVNMIAEQAKNNPKDTMLYSEYFVYRTMLVGKEKSLKEVDSMFSDYSQYGEMFKELIEDYSSDPKSGVNW
ncbi:hypothetical protein [Chryseobacterium sp. MFBS3-17]|uniref:hypothetical protein n=1 Tax=Chryseobacterium sp. MFBS3-17 TaxID=2886689 RepID=UPI001D0DFC79|nr:hypothetical protein [Chryseobacterium sp. MFBS3-17]MCC2589517.1 hypothetical protein [Chryseobacterium sp. MFBS3-17]